MINDPPELSDADVVRVEYALNEIFKELLDARMLIDLFDESEKDHSNEFLAKMQEIMAEVTPRIDLQLDKLADVLNMDPESPHIAERRDAVQSFFGPDQISYAGAFREALAQLTSDNLRQTMRNHRVPDSWADWFLSNFGV